MDKIAVTGIGVVTPSGTGKRQFWANVKAGRSFIKEITRFSAYRYPSHIAGQIWSYGMGNHEATANAAYCSDISVRILERIGRPECYAGWSAMVRIVFQDGEHRSALRVYHQHGYQAGRKDGAKVNGLDDLMGYIDGCHIYLVGHSHSRLVKTKTKLGANPSFTKEQAITCFGAHTGSFLRTYQEGTVGYGERAGYPPVPIGPLEFLVKPSRTGIEIKAVQ